MKHPNHTAIHKPCFNKPIDADEWSDALIQFRKEKARNFKYANYNPVFGWEDKYRFLSDLSVQHRDKLIIQYCVHQDTLLENNDSLPVALKYKGLLYYNERGLNATLSSLTDALYAYYMSGTMCKDLDLSKSENLVLGAMITSNLFRSKRGYCRLIDIAYGHISKEFGYVVSSGLNITESTLKKTVASLIKKGYLLRVSDKHKNTAYRYMGMSDLIVMLPFDSFLTYKATYGEQIKEVNTLTPTMKSALSRAMMMHTTSLVGSVSESKVLHYLFHNIVHLGKVDTPISKYGMAKTLGLSQRNVFYAVKSLIEKGLLTELGPSTNKSEAKLYDIPIFPFQFEKGDISNYLYDCITELQKYGTGLLEASSTMLSARDHNHVAMYNNIRNLSGNDNVQEVYAVELDVKVPDTILDGVVERQSVGAFKSYFDHMVELLCMQNSSRDSTTNPNKIFNTYNYLKEGIMRKDTSVSFSPLTGRTLGLHPEDCIKHLKEGLRKGSLSLPSNSIARLLLGAHDLMSLEYCQGEPTKVPCKKFKTMIGTGEGVTPTTIMTVLLASAPYKSKKQITQYAHQYPTAVLPNYRLTDIEAIFRFLFNEVTNNKFKQNSPPIAPPSFGSRKPLDPRATQHNNVISFAQLIMCVMSVEMKYVDMAGDMSARLPIKTIIKEAKRSFMKGWFFMPNVDNMTLLKQDVEDMQDLLITLCKIKHEALNAQKIIRFITKDNEESEEDFFKYFITSGYYFDDNIEGVKNMGLTVKMPLRTTETMFKKSPLIRNYLYANDVELRSSYAFNYLFNMVNQQTFGTLRHNITKYFNGCYKFISICQLEQVISSIKRAIKMKVDKLVDTPFEMMPLVDYADENRRAYRHYGANLFQNSVKRKLSQVYDDILEQLNDCLPHAHIVDNTFNAFKTIDNAMVRVEQDSTPGKPNKYHFTERIHTTTDYVVDYSLPSNLMAVMLSKSRQVALENGERVLKYTEVDKHTLTALETALGRDLSTLAQDVQSYIDKHLQFTMSYATIGSKYSSSYVWEMPHVIKTLHKFKRFTNKVYEKDSTYEFEERRFDGRVWVDSYRKDPFYKPCWDDC